MLAEQQLIEWFRSNGVDIGIPFPMPLVDRLCRKALSTDEILFCFLSKSFRPHKRNFLILNFDNWDDVFACYSSHNLFPNLKVQYGKT